MRLYAVSLCILQGFANFTKLLGLNSPADLLAPEHQDLLTKVIQFHIVPGPPLNAMQLQVRWCTVVATTYEQQTFLRQGHQQHQPVLSSACTCSIWGPLILNPEG